MVKRLFFLLKQKKYDEIIGYMMKNDINFNDDYNYLLILKMPIYADGETIAHQMAWYRYEFPIDRMDILTIKNNNGWSVAHEMALYGYKFPINRKDILSIKDNAGWSVAHVMASNRYNFTENEIEILTIKDNTGWSVAHTMACNNKYRFPENRTDILTIKDNYGWSIAHEMARQGYKFSENNNILELKDDRGQTVDYIYNCYKKFNIKEDI